MSFQTDSDYDMFIAGSEYPLRITFTGPAISATPTNNAVFDINMPSFRYTAYPTNVGGPGRISIPFQGRAMWNAGSGTACTITLVNTKTTTYVTA